MKISTKGRYALRMMLDLAEHREQGFVSLKEIAARQDISLKYIERLMPVLKSAGLVESVHGIGGGYRLAREPETCTLWDILQRSEGDLAPVSCLKDGTDACARATGCRTLPVWNRLGQIMGDYLDSVTLRDLLKTDE